VRKVWLFSMVLGHSRWLWGRFCPNQSLDTVMRCHIAAFDAMGGACTEILYDWMKTAVIGEDAAGVVNAQFEEWRTTIANPRVHATTRHAADTGAPPPGAAMSQAEPGAMRRNSSIPVRKTSSRSGPQASPVRGARRSCRPVGGGAGHPAQGRGNGASSATGNCRVPRQSIRNLAIQGEQNRRFITQNQCSIGYLGRAVEEADASDSLFKWTTMS
jgi:hypothetical protein